MLRASGLVGKKGLIKVLGRGDIAKALTVHAHKFSGKAAEKIAAAGGRTEVLA
jgi:large subunit ribosomal protein L15